MAFCERCGNYFNDGGDAWKKLCLSCWKRKKRTETGSDGLVDYWRQRALKAETLLEIKKSIYPAPATLPADLTDHLKTLIFLCHPDKHGNDARATVATQYLLSLREMMR